MLNYFQVDVQYKPRQRQQFNAFLALVTGILTLIYPSFLYLIAGGYLLALGLLFLAFRLPSGIVAFPIIAGILIFIFPDLIPITFGIFLSIFGLLLLLSFQLIFLGVITLIIAVLTFSNPDWIAYLIAAFMLLYGVSNIIELIRQKTD
ncbi:MAG: hypothetical protein ACQETE_00765 [Bacteroidota bacterium]